MRAKPKPFRPQKIGLKRVLREPFSFLFMDPGTGKTPIAIWSIEHRFTHNECKRVIVFAPSTILDNWYTEVRKFMGMHKKEYSMYSLGYGNNSTWKDNMRKAYADSKSGKPVIVILNYEKARVLYDWIKHFNPDYMIVDELHKLRHRSADMSRKIYYLSRKCKFRLGLTGTPICGGYEDLFMEYKIIDEEIFGSNYKSFESRYVKKGGYGGYSIVGYKNKKELRRIVKRTSYRVNIDTMNLPPLHEQVMMCDLTSKARKAYHEMEEDMMTYIENHAINQLPRSELKALCRQHHIYYDPKESYVSLLMKVKNFLNTASCELVITQVMRLQQIVGGFVTMDSGEVKFVGSHKISITKEIVAEAKRPVVIVCRYVAEIDRLVEELSKIKRGGKPLMVWGYRDRKKRSWVYREFKKGKIDVLVIQISSGGVGLNLQRADQIIIYSGNSSYDEDKQVIHRIKRSGQKHRMKVYRLISQGTVDEDILASSQGKRKLSEWMID